MESILRQVQRTSKSGYVLVDWVVYFVPTDRLNIFYLNLDLALPTLPDPSRSKDLGYR